MGILGKPFRGYVKQQIDQREYTLGRDNNFAPIQNTTAGSDKLHSLFQNTPWIRLSSGVDLINPTITEFVATEGFSPETRQVVDTQNTVLTSFKERGYDVGKIQGAELAKHFVLFGGVISQEDESVQQYYGLSGNRWGGAYGLGLQSDIQNERGYIPMPGIEDVNLSYKNDGALAQATIKIKCYSRSQFEIIDALYMRPGYTALLEFGHSKFVNNEGQIVNAGESGYSFYTEPFSGMGGELSYSDLKTKILNEKEKWNGNYEGFYGKVSKFNWSFSNNVYNITVSLIGFGDVINSLNAAKPITSKDTTIENESTNLLHAFATKSTFNKRLYDIFISKGGVVEFNAKGELKTNHKLKEDGESKLSDLNLVNEYELTKGKTTTPYSSIYKELTYKTFNEENNSIEVKKIGGNLPKSFFQIFGLTDDFKSSWTSSGYKDSYKPNSYISFGAFCLMLQNEANIYTKKGEDGKDFLFNLNMNFGNLEEDTTYMKTFAGMFSSNPSRVLIPYLPIGDNPNNNLFPDGDSLDDIFMLTKFNKNNTNPASQFALSLSTQLKDTFYPDLPEFKKGDFGRLAFVMLDVAYLTTLISNNLVQSQEGTTTISPRKILEEILREINVVSGGVNNFRLVENVDNGFISIVNQSPQQLAKNSQEEYQTINSYGFTDNPKMGSSNLKGSFVKNVELSSELSDNFATQITIGAQASTSQLGEEASSFSTYNKGLIDRVIPQKFTTQGLVDRDQPTKTLNDLFTAKNKKLIESMYIGKVVINVFGYPEIDNKIQFDEDKVNALQTWVRNYSQLFFATQIDKGEIQAPFFLPFNLSLDILGMGGLRIYDGFKFDGKILPLSYQPDKVSLIISSLSHRVNSSGWNTKIETLTQPIIKVKEVKATTRIPTPTPTPTAPLEEIKTEIYTQQALNETTPVPAIRNRNPLNLRPSGDNWQGLVSENGGFVQFDSFENGLRASYINMATIYSRGYTTIKQLISIWAPQSENPTESYITEVAKYLGKDENARINFNDSGFMARLATAMARVEAGPSRVDDKEFLKFATQVYSKYSVRIKGNL